MTTNHLDAIPIEAEPEQSWPRLAQRWAMHLYFRLTRAMTLGVRAAVLDKEERIFLVRHTYVPGWHLPGGGVEVGETLNDALVKELREEAMIGLNGPAVLHGVFFSRSVSRRDHVAVFVVRDFIVTGIKMPDREIAETGWFGLDALPEGVTASTRRRLLEIQNGRTISADW